MTARERILNDFIRPQETNGLYELLKSCLITKESYDTVLDEWFGGVINSLYYRPNHNALVLLGKQSIGKTIFLQKLVYDAAVDEGGIYDNLILDVEFKSKSSLNIVLQDNFTTEKGEYPCDKRLASYCSSSNNWVYPQRKNIFIIPVERVDLERLFCFDMQSCWIEIYNKFKPK